MTGFAGIVYADNRTVDQDTLKKLAAALAVRGLDGVDTWSEGNAGLALASPRPESGSGRPPAVLVRGPLAVVADVRLDARDDLLRRFDPEQRSAHASDSHAGLILSCYERWGSGCLDHITGDFSFAIWDRGRRRILCARDQLGVKPLFFAATGDAFLFSNTLDCLLVDPSLAGGMDRMAIADFLLFGQYQDPFATAFVNLRRLPAGHSLEWCGGTPAIRRYWALPFGDPVRFECESEYIEGFRHHLNNAVSDRMHPQRTAILMSGGLDSTMIAAAAAGQERSVESFAIVYERLIADPERKFAQRAADALNIPLRFLAADDYLLFDRPPGPYRATAEPVDEPVPAVFTDHLLQIQSFSQVALSGVGGDQLLFPSPNLAINLLKSGQLGGLADGLWRFVRLRRRFPAVGFRSGLLRSTGSAGPPEISFPPWLNPGLESDLGLRERWKRTQERNQDPNGTSHPQRPEAYCQLTDLAWPRIFETYDPGVTRIPVDVRHPLFDLRLVNYCLGVPPIPWFVDKTLARVAMRNCLPDAIRLRPKSFAADAVAPRLFASPWIDSWKPVPELAQFVDRSRIPALAIAGSSWDPHHRPFALNQWLSQLTHKA